MVRPNAEVIPSDHSLSVKIVTQNPISAVSDSEIYNIFIQQSSQALLADRFLVQLTKLETMPPKALSPEEIAKLWDNVDKKNVV